MKPERRLTLLPRLGPPVLAGLTAANLLSRSVWNKIRGHVMREAGGRSEFGRGQLEYLIPGKHLIAGARCEICRASYRDRMVCDEVWSYNQRQRRATLRRLRLLCQACNSVVHMNVVLRQHPYGVRLCLTGSGPRLEMWSKADAQPAVRVLAHMMRVNRIGSKKTAEVAAHALAVRFGRGNEIWKVRVAPPLLPKFPELKVLDGRTSESRLRERVASRWLGRL